MSDDVRDAWCRLREQALAEGKGLRPEGLPLLPKYPVEPLRVEDMVRGVVAALITTNRRVMAVAEAMLVPLAEVPRRFGAAYAEALRSWPPGGTTRLVRVALRACDPSAHRRWELRRQQMRRRQRRLHR